MNRLEGSPSPYLQQHAQNPVYWWPWCEDALAQAKRRDVPVLLSVGYASCHWCHETKASRKNGASVLGGPGFTGLCVSSVASESHRWTPFPGSRVSRRVSPRTE
jgi:hypothetical protein